jgi:RNA-splicing ligase RtcB
MENKIPFEGKHTTAVLMIGHGEEIVAKLTELVNNASFTNPIVVMPDGHEGKGACVGFTMELADNVISNVIGVDQACGVLGVELETDFFSDVDAVKEEFDRLVRQAIPMGNRVHKKPVFSMKTEFSYADVQRQVAEFSKAFNARYGTNYHPASIDYRQFVNWCNRVGCAPDYAECSIGTMGGGNHFIEVGISENTGRPWIFIHSGSRNLGKCSAEYWQHRAVQGLAQRREEYKTEAIAKVKENFPKEQWQEQLSRIKTGPKLQVTRTLEPLFGKDMYDYLVDSIFAYHYSQVNRFTMLNAIMRIIGEPAVTNIIHTVHNYIDHEDFIIRKGAVGAREDEYFILPFNLEDGTLICRGKGNPEWNYSAPHGAGRIYSRKQAKEKLSADPVRKRLERKGIYSSQLPLDELPDAYKPAKWIEEAIAPTADIVDRVRPIINFKTKKG